jgi:hypothetical protein
MYHRRNIEANVRIRGAPLIFIKILTKMKSNFTSLSLAIKKGWI